MGGPEIVVAYRGQEVDGPWPAQPNSFCRLWWWKHLLFQPNICDNFYLCSFYHFHHYIAAIQRLTVFVTLIFHFFLIVFALMCTMWDAVCYLITVPRSSFNFTVLSWPVVNHSHLNSISIWFLAWLGLGITLLLRGIRMNCGKSAVRQEDKDWWYSHTNIPTHW